LLYIEVPIIIKVIGLSDDGLALLGYDAINGTYK